MRKYAAFALAAALAVAIAAYLTADQFKEIFPGHSTLLLALVSLTGLAIGLLAKEILGGLSGLLRETLVPLDRVSVFIEDIKFDYPIIPDHLMHRSPSKSEISNLQNQRFSSSIETLTVTDEEAERINHIGRGYRYLNQVIAGEPYGMPEVFLQFISNPLGETNNLRKLSTIMNDWVELLSRHRADSKATMEKFVSQELDKVLIQMPDALKYIIDIVLDGDLIKIRPEPGPKVDNSIESIVKFLNLQTAKRNHPDFGLQTEHMWVVMRDRYYYLGSGTLHDRVYIENFMDLIFTADTDGLIDLFEKVSPALERTSRIMSEYLTAWNEILRNRESNSFSLTATLSNTGRFNSFVKSKGKVVIGHSDTTGQEQKREFIVETQNEPEDKTGKALYIPVKSREAKTVRFVAQLNQNDRESIKGAFSSSLLYMKLGLLVSIGKHESKIVSPLSPFSIKAREQHDEKIKSMRINFF